MAYRYDHDLEFLGELDNNRLENLVEILTKDKDGSARMTETLTVSKEYKEHSYNYSRYWQRIAEEIQLFGGNSFANMFRNGGVKYEEILKDVCDKMKVNYNKNSSTKRIEEFLLNKILEDSLEKMSEEERQEIVKELDINTTSFGKQAVMGALQIAIKQSGFAAYKAAVIIANAVAKAILGHGLKFATNAAITRSIGMFAGPIGWAITGLWTAVDLAGPAYRVTIPICIEIACLRVIHQYEKQNKIEENQAQQA